MKKLLIIFFCIFLSFRVLSCEFKNTREYTEKSKKILNMPKIMEFFSFFCPYCFEFEKKYNIKNIIKKHVKIQRYHVNFLGGKLSYILTKAWIMAQKIGIEDKIIMPIFIGIQKNNTIHNLQNIKTIFFQEAQINEEEYNKLWNSFTLKILVEKSNQDIIKCQLNRVPSILINGKYIIEYSKLEKYFKHNYLKKYMQLIEFLLKK